MTTLTTIIPGSETTTIPASEDGGKDLPAAINAADEPLSGAARKIPRVQPEWKKPGCCSKPGDRLCQIVSVIFHPIFLVFFLIILLLDLIYRWISPCWRGNWSACLRRDWLYDLLGLLASGLLGFCSIFAVGLVGHYPMALKFANHFGFMLAVRLLAFTPWPMGRTRKIFALARMNRVRDVARLTGMARGDRETDSREAAVDMWRAIEMRDRTEQRRFNLVRAYIQRGADINFPNEDGSTLLHHFAAYIEPDYIKWLLANHADPNIQDVRGNTPLHVACMSKYDGADVIRALVENPKTDACVYNCDGRSPLMLRLHKKKPIDALTPAVSWEAIEVAISQPSAAHCLTQLENLAISGPHALRLPDHLFGGNIPSDELERRRIEMWLRLLKPVTLEVCTSKELNEREKAVLHYVWAATEGPKQWREDARRAYREEIQDVFEEVAVAFAEQMWLSQPNAKAHKKFSLQEVEEIRAIAEENLHHGSFQQLPGWAITRDLLQAIKELERLRILRFAEDLCDLLRCGRISCEQSHVELSMLNKSRYDVFTTRRQIHTTKRLKKVPTPRSNSKIAWDAEIGQLPQPSPKSQSSNDSVGSLPSRNSSRISCGSNLSTLSTTSSHADPRAASKNRKVPDASVDFWMGLVSVWLVALHLYIQPSFLRRISQISQPGECVVSKTKDFEYVMKKARTRIRDSDLKAWRDKVLAPLYVTDILSCTFEVKTPERASEIEEALATMFAVVYSENCYDYDLDDHSVKHCHHEFVYLVESDFTELGHVAILAQVKVVLVTSCKVEHKLNIVRDVVTDVEDLAIDEV